MTTKTTRIEVCEDQNVGGHFARAGMSDGSERDIPLEDWQTEDDQDIRDEVARDMLTGHVSDDCPVTR